MPWQGGSVGCSVLCTKGCWFDSQLGHVQEETDRRFFLSLKSINTLSGEDRKKTPRDHYDGFYRKKKENSNTRP